jgi:hypothetical protein
MNKHVKSKQQYDENYLNGPLNATSSVNAKNGLNHAKRAMNNQSQQNHHNADEQIRHQVHHKRVVSS